MLIDAHVHLADDRRRYGGTGAQMRDARQRLGDIMDAHGIDAAVLVASRPEDTSAIEVAADEPSRFTAIGVVDLLEDDVRERATWWLDAGARGIRVRTVARAGTALASLPDVLRLLADNDAILWAYLPCEEWAVLDRTMREVAAPRVLINHGGFCSECRPGEPDAVLDVLANQPSCAVMLAGLHAYSKEPYPYADLHSWIARLYRTAGAARMAWASDFPWSLRRLAYGENSGLVGRLLPTSTTNERDLIMGGTIARLLTWPDSTPG